MVLRNGAEAMIPSFTTFVASVLAITLTMGQRVFGLVAYDGVDPIDLTDSDEHAMALQLFGDVPWIPTHARHVIVGVCGRRGGKSYALGALRLLHLALSVPLGRLAPGETAYAVIVAPDLRLARQTLRFVLGAAKSNREIARCLSNETADSFTIKRPDGGTVVVECLPATRGGSALRGRSLVCALLDEACFFRDEAAVVNDVEIMRALAPSILPGGQLLLLSSPWLEQGLVFDLFKMNHGAPATALVAIAPTLLLRDDEETRLYVERETANDPDSAAVEFGAQFRGGGAGYFFDPTTILDAVDAKRPQILYAPPGAMVTAGGDIGLVRDSSALVVGGRVEQIFVVCETLELRPQASAPLKLSYVIEQFGKVLKRHELSSFTADGYSLEPAREHAAARDIFIQAAAGGQEAKAQAYLGLQQGFREGRVRIPNHPRLIAQLRSVVAKPLPGGGLKIDTPRRAGQGHGDIASALVLAHSSGNTPGAGMVAALAGLVSRGGIREMARQIGVQDPQEQELERLRERWRFLG
jgi:hypothetical protein